MNRIRQTKIYIGYQFLKKWLQGICFIFPIQKNKIVFDNFGGRGFGDDPKYIAKELCREKNLQLIWMTNDLHIDLPKEIIPVKYGSLLAAYHWATAAVWIDNIKNSQKIRKKKGQYYIQTWHSTLGFKMNEMDAKNLSPTYVKKAKRDARQTNLMYADNDFRIDKYRNHYWYTGQVIKCDVPRMAIMLSCSDAIRQKVYAYFHISKDDNLVLYAPTFRKNRNLDLYKFQYQPIVAALEEKFGGHYKMLIRLHPNDAAYSQNLDYVLDASEYEDMQELLAVAQILITDYSGCMFDFGFAHKPVFLYAKDLNEYLQYERRKYFDFEKLPFSFSKSEQQLRENIACFSMDAYIKKCKALEAFVGYKDDGDGARVLAQMVLEKIKE